MSFWNFETISLKTIKGLYNDKRGVTWGHIINIDSAKMMETNPKPEKNYTKAQPFIAGQT